MKYLFNATFLILSSCFFFQSQPNVFNNLEFERVIEAYINNYKEIPNSSNAKPIYEIFFEIDNDTVGFWISSTLGGSSLIPPLEPGIAPPTNPLQNKGVFYYKGKIICIFDYKTSKGYGLYDPTNLINIDSVSFKDIGTCGHEKYPNSYFYKATADSLYLVEIAEGICIK